MSLNSIPQQLLESVIAIIGGKAQSFQHCAGGCINNGGMLQTSQGKFFLKWNDAQAFPEMFEKEKLGLKLLQSAGCIRTPSVIATGNTDTLQFIIMEWIGQGAQSLAYGELLGRQLAALHKHRADKFGLDHDNYIGSLPQYNHRCNSWSEFFITQRLEPQIRSLQIDTQRRKTLDRFYQRVEELIPEDQPSLLHGDLWSGNTLADENGLPAVIDPAVYYGHREAELAFTRLFGGFAEAFYSAYHEVFPLEPEHHKRVDLFNVYPLLVHANLFGGSYLLQAFRIIEHWG